MFFYILGYTAEWQRLPLQNYNRKKKKNSKAWTLGYVNSIVETGGGGVLVSGGGRERERERETGETGGITIFFYSREIFGLIFLSLKG